MKTIHQRQNKPEALKLQATARYYYNKADRIDLIHWIGIIFTIILKLMFQSNLFIDFLLILSFITGFIIEYFLDKWTAIAADCKEKFDNYVFEIKNDNLEITNIEVIKDIEKNKKWFKTQMENDGDDVPKGVKNWYTGNENMKLFEAMKLAYKENIYYDSSINSIIRWIIILVFSVVSIIVYFNGTSTTYLLNTFFITIASLTAKVINIIINLYKSNELNKKINNIIEQSTDVEELSRVQKYLYEKRKIPGISLNIIYQISKSKISSMFKAIFVEPDL